MSDTLTDPLPPTKTHEKHARLEVDAFCPECGYNLHSQAVTRDERLGIFVCRCPECGRWMPAGVGVTATNVWLRRFATILLLFWVLIILFAVFWIVMGLGAIQVAYVDDFSYNKMVAADGRDVEFLNPSPGSVYKGTTQPVTSWRYVYTLVPQKGSREPSLWDVGAFALGAVAMGFVTGLLLVVFLWHWRRRNYVWPMLLPLAVAAFVSAVYVVNDEYDLIRGWAIRTGFGWAMFEMAFMGVGILLGRPIVRGLLRMFIPPRPRQHFAFLWSADGKTVPPARTLQQT